MSYSEFLSSKKLVVSSVGKVIEDHDIHPTLFPFQRDLVRWAVRKGRCAIFADTGLGKTYMSLQWAALIGERVLMVAPLAVALQTVREASKLDMDVCYVRNQSEVTDEHTIYITNYEMLPNFDGDTFGAVVLDESSILKNLDGKIKTRLVTMFAATPYRLCCTATPAPNDITEIANHAEFLGVMTRQEMLSVFFTYNNAEGTSKSDSWRLKRHAIEQFYEWLASWGMAVKKPSDIGYEDTAYILPPINVHLETVDADYTPEGMLPGFFVGRVSAIDAKTIRRYTTKDRVDACIKLVNGNDQQWIVWAGLNDEAEALEASIPGSINIHGSMSPEEKSELMLAFQDGQYRVLISKIKIAGFGMNFQNASNMVFCGIDYSWEGYYQAIRRIYRFGQVNPVNVHVVISQQEIAIFNSVMNKETEAIAMTKELIKNSAQYARNELEEIAKNEFVYRQDDARSDNWHFMLGDSVERISEIADNSIDLSIYSPPFSDLFVYSNTPRDVGNSKTLEEFFHHYSYIIQENYRITKPGRLACVHVQDLRALKTHDGYIGRKDFSGAVIEAYQREGWVFWQRVTIDKNPQAQAIRLKDHGLLFKTLKKDSTNLAGGHADYLLIFKKPGDNAVPVTPYENGEVTSEDWISWAHPVWYDISESDTLNVRVARSDQDEKHMCPLQLPLIARCVKLWSNPGEVVFSPFGGIASEGYEAVRLGRKYIGIELKPEYWQVGIHNLENAEKMTMPDLFKWAEQQAE